MPASDNSVSVFLSYARGDDEDFVRRLYTELKAQGFTVWFDRDSLMSRSLTFHQEIRDAIRCEVDRVVYVGGPKAAVSAYVREEWQTALEFDHVVVTPILRLGDFVTEVPGEIGLLHCEDFRDDAKYPAALAKLFASLRQPNPKLGGLKGVPDLPPHFLARPELMRRVKDALLVDLQTAQAITGADARVGMQGMGGIGKSVLANALARNREVRHSYPDGIVWIGFGQHLTDDDILSRLRELVRQLGGEAVFQSIPEGQGVLRELMHSKAVLLVMDDVWRAADAKAFDHLGPRCRMLVTTRDAGILHTLHGGLVPVSLFTEPEALQLLADAVDLKVSALPAEAREVADECGLLPLALALSGGMAKKRCGDFHSVLERLRRADLDKIADREAINEQHRSIWRAMQASVEMLDEEEQRRFVELAVFSNDETVTEAAVATFWAHTGDLDDLSTEEFLINLAERSLIQLDQKTDDDGRIQRRVSLHDLLHHYVRNLQLKWEEEFFLSEFRWLPQIKPVFYSLTEDNFGLPWHPAEFSNQLRNSGLPLLTTLATKAITGRYLPSALASAAQVRFASATDADPVDCTVFGPPTATVDDMVLLQIFAHMSHDAENVGKMAQEFDEESRRIGFRSLELDVKRDSVLIFELSLPGLEIDDPVQQLIWRGSPCAVQFAVTVPKTHACRNIVGKVAIYSGDIPLGHIRFKLKIVATPESALPEPLGDDAKRYQNAFISYSSTDRDEVLKRVQILDRCGIRFFQDVLDLDPGDRWEKQLYHHIDQCDLFLLFWSSAAKQSEWVEKEVAYALARKIGGDSIPLEIVPILIEGPPVPPPPNNLSHLHFNDRLLYFLSDSRK